MRLLYTILYFTVGLMSLHCEGQTNHLEGHPRIAFWEVGSGKETIIALHGGPGAAHDYLEPEWNALAQSGKVVYYDQRGCGKSARADCYSWRAHVRDLKRVVDCLSKGKKVILVGSSWGSTLALLYAYTYSSDVKAIVLSGTYNWIGKGLAPKDCEAYLPSASYLLQENDTLQLRSLRRGTTAKEKYCEVHTVSTGMTINSMADAPGLSQLATIKVPVLIFKGADKCGETPVREGADIYKAVLVNAQVFDMPDTCHDPWLQNPDVFFQKANEFIQTLK